MKVINQLGEVTTSDDRRYVGYYGGFEIFEGSEVNVVNDRGFKEKGKIVYSERFSGYQVAVFSEKLNRTFFFFLSKVTITGLIKK